MNSAFRILPVEEFETPNINLDVKDELFCREYINYEEFDKTVRTKEGLIKTMNKACIVLEGLGVKYALGMGTLLGFYRNNDFLKTDAEIDINIIGDDRDIFKIIDAMPLEPMFVTINKGHYQQFALLDRETEVIIDLWFFYKKEDYLINRGYFGYFWLPAVKYENLEKFNFEGRSYPIPEPEWYCEFWYGKNWRTPKKYANDWSIEYKKDCKGLIYTGEKDIIYERYF